jgi:hypothetical protein
MQDDHKFEASSGKVSNSYLKKQKSWKHVSSVEHLPQARSPEFNPHLQSKAKQNKFIKSIIVGKKGELQKKQNEK